MTENDRLKARMRKLEQRIDDVEARYEILIAYIVADAIEVFSGEVNEEQIEPE